MLAPSLPLLRLPDRGTGDRNPNPTHSRTKVTPMYPLTRDESVSRRASCVLMYCWDNGVRYSLARFGVANAAVCQNLIERAVIEDRTIECFRIPFRHHRQLQCPRLSNEVHCAMAKQP